MRSRIVFVLFVLGLLGVAAALAGGQFSEPRSLTAASSPLGTGPKTIGVITTDDVVAGCAPAGTIVDDQPFTPYEGRRGYPPDLPITFGAQAVGAEVPRLAFPTLSVPDVLGLELQATLAQSHDWDTDGVDERGLVQWYGPRPIAPGETADSYFADRGLVIAQDVPHGRDADLVVSELVDTGYQPLTLMIGPHKAAMVHGDPRANGIRVWGLYWSDGARDMVVRSAGPPEELVDIARSLYCTSSP